MRFDRCDICGYTEEDGSDLTNRGPSGRIKVTWSENHKENQCTSCRAVISNTGKDYKLRTKKIYNEEQVF